MADLQDQLDSLDQRHGDTLRPHAEVHPPSATAARQQPTRAKQKSPAIPRTQPRLALHEPSAAGSVIPPSPANATTGHEIYKSHPLHDNRAMQRIKLGLLLFVGIGMIALLLLHTPGINGPFYWKWQWRRLSPLPLYAGMTLAVAPLLAAQFLNRQKKSGLVLALLLLMTTCFGMKLAMALVRTDYQGLNFVRDIVVNPHISGYYLDAVHFSNTPLRQWMQQFPKEMPSLTMHAQSKPPGPILYWYVWVKLLGPGDRTMIIGGLGLGLLAAIGICTTYWLLRRMLQDEPAAFAGASFLAMCPGFVLFFPMLDPSYTILSTLMIGFWWIALRENRLVFAAITGVVVAAVLLIAFNVLAAGIFMIGLIFWASDDKPIPARINRGMKQAIITAVAMIATLVALWIAIGYNPISTFLVAWTNQQALLTQHANERPYPTTILFDLTDFAMGSGWIAYLLVVFYFTRGSAAANIRLALLAVVQLIIVAITGLLQSETSRVWNFMLPLLMIPVGLELSKWDRSSRLACYGLLALLTMVIYQNMTFLF